MIKVFYSLRTTTPRLPSTGSGDISRGSATPATRKSRPHQHRPPPSRPKQALIEPAPSLATRAHRHTTTSRGPASSAGCPP